MTELIKQLAEMAVEETEGAHHYAKLACKNKKDYPQMADAVASMAMQELTHAETLAKMAKTILDADHGTSEEHEKVQYLYDYLNEKVNDNAVMVRACLEKYKSMN